MNVSEQIDFVETQTLQPPPATYLWSADGWIRPVARPKTEGKA